MGFWKKEGERRRENLVAATEIAKRAGAVEECEFHEGNYFGHGDREAAYKLGNHLYSQGDDLVADFRDRREMTDAIKAAINDAGDECGFCAKWRDE